jgi:hypothetical protein
MQILLCHFYQKISKYKRRMGRVLLCKNKLPGTAGKGAERKQARAYLDVKRN